MDNKKIVIYGGGTVYHVRPHLALSAVAYGGTARKLAELSKEILPAFDVDLRLTKMAGGRYLETNNDIAEDVKKIINDDTTKVVIMSAALADFEGMVVPSEFWLEASSSSMVKNLWSSIENDHGKYGTRLNSSQNYSISLCTAKKVISEIRKTRKDIFLVGFKTTSGAIEDEQYIAGLNLCKKSSCNLVLANDVKTRMNMVITPEEARYHVTDNRDEVLRGLLEMVFHRTHLTFTRSTVIAGDPVSWDSELIPSSLRTVVDFCIDSNAYKPFNGVTAGHFACKVNDTTFLTSIRKTNFNDLSKNGLVKIVTDGPDTVLAYGARPSVGGQSQRIVFHDHPDVDCIVHFHCEKRAGSQVPTVSQREFECGSMECGINTSKGLKRFGNLYAVYLDQHGPNIVFNRSTDPQEVINFIQANFDLSTKTGGFVSLKSRMDTPYTLDFAKKLL